MDSNLPNHDIVTEIFLYLPFTSLLRFRSVCKSRRDHINSQAFRNSHIQQHASDNGSDNDTLLVQFSFRQDGVSELPMFNGKLYNNFLPASPEILDYHLKLSLDTTSVVPRPQIVGPANGVICINYRDSDAPVAICNPSLGHITILPPNPNTMSFEPNSHRTLCRDVGIWFDKVAQDYVVLQLLTCHRRFGFENGFHLHASVYSKSMKSWRGLTVGGSDIFGHGLCILSHIHSSCKNGSFSHWLAIDKAGNQVILSFDFRSEGFRVLEIANLEILKRFGDIKIFAEGDDSFLVFISGDREEPERLKMFWLRIEGNRLQWDGMKSVGPFDGLVIPKALCEKGCVVLESKNGCFLLYDYWNKKRVKWFEMKRDTHWTFEYRGSFVLP